MNINRYCIYSTAAVDALWALSFDKETRKDMIENQEWKVMSTLEKLSGSSDKIVETTTKKALWTINNHKNSCKYINDIIMF